jgi:hypothetical protein
MCLSRRSIAPSHAPFATTHALLRQEVEQTVSNLVALLGAGRSSSERQKRLPWRAQCRPCLWNLRVRILPPQPASPVSLFWLTQGSERPARAGLFARRPVSGVLEFDSKFGIFAKSLWSVLRKFPFCGDGEWRLVRGLTARPAWHCTQVSVTSKERLIFSSVLFAILTD